MFRSSSRLSGFLAFLNPCSQEPYHYSFVFVVCFFFLFTSNLMNAQWFFQDWCQKSLDPHISFGISLCLSFFFFYYAIFGC